MLHILDTQEQVTVSIELANFGIRQRFKIIS